METKKNPDYDINRSRKGLLQLGVISGLALCLSAFEYTSFSHLTAVHGGKEIDILDVEKIYEIPEKPEPVKEKPEKPKTLTNSVQQSTPVQTATEFTINNNKIINAATTLSFDGTVLSVPLYNDEPVIGNDDITVVEDMPYYKELETILDKDDRKSATDAKMLGILHSEIQYPALARELDIQGTVYVSFRINKKGKVEDANILRSAHPELDAEALRVVNLLPPMEPGRQRGKAVNVRYTIPVKFVIK